MTGSRMARRSREMAACESRDTKVGCCIVIVVWRFGGQTGGRLYLATLQLFFFAKCLFV